MEQRLAFLASCIVNSSHRAREATPTLKTQYHNQEKKTVPEFELAGRLQSPQSLYSRNLHRVMKGQYL